MISKDLTNYMKAIKFKNPRQKEDKKIKFSKTEFSKALEKQEKRCIKCKKDLNPFYSKKIRDPLTKELKIICSDCAITLKKRE